ncbi:Ac_RPExFGAL, putative mycofactocin binding protein MftB [Acidimicrobiia bacterium]
MTATLAPFDADRHWRLHERVALRPEPFGALAYHYGNRRLTFLRSPDLVTLVELIGDQPDALSAFVAAGIDPARWPSFEKALTSLVAGEFLVGDDHVTEVENSSPSVPESETSSRP